MVDMYVLTGGEKSSLSDTDSSEFWLKTKKKKMKMKWNMMLSSASGYYYFSYLVIYISIYFISKSLRVNSREYWSNMYNFLMMLYFVYRFYSKNDFRWIREVFMSSTIGFQRMGRKLDLEKKERFTFHLLLRDERPGGVQSRNIVDAIDHSKRVVIILSA